MDDSIITKRCSKCKENLPTSEFNKDRSAKDGLQAYCRECLHASQKAWREANPEKCKASQKAWREANPEYQKAWREANPEYQKAWRTTNPEKCKAHQHNRRARDRNAQGSHTAEQASARFAVHGDACIYCSSTEDLHVDHVKPLNKGGSNWASNLAPACASCNLSKQDKWGPELRAWIRETCTVPRTRRMLG